MSENSSLSSDPLFHYCISILTTSLSIRTSLLPLSVFILYLGLQRWRQQLSLKSESHINVFTYQLAVKELVCVSGCLFQLCATPHNTSRLTTLSQFAIMIGVFAEMLFNSLICVERYVAVLYPVVYLRLKNARGVRIRNIIIGGAWLLTVGLASPHLVTDQYSTIITMGLLVFTIIVNSFCSLSVLCVLVRPGPGEGGGGGEKERVDQSKRRAFNIITAISSTQWFWFMGLLYSIVEDRFTLLGPGVSCCVKVSLSFCNLPSFLLLPLLFLRRTGKLSCYCYSKG